MFPWYHHAVRSLHTGRYRKDKAENRMASARESAETGEYTSIVLLMDFYGELLTPRQSEVLDLHYNSDLSLAEIAEELTVSRQAVHDAVRTGKALLMRYESKLGLAARFLKQQDMVREALGLVNGAMESESAETQRALTQQAGARLLQLLEQL